MSEVNDMAGQTMYDDPSVLTSEVLEIGEFEFFERSE